MCNLYANTMPQDAMRRLFKTLDRLGNQEPLTAIFPDAEVPIVRIGDAGARELVKARWGWDKTPRGWVTNARNLDKSWGVIRNVSQKIYCQHMVNTRGDAFGPDFSVRR